MIKEMEERSMNAWPALQTLLYDGWVLRFANGYTRRANSVNPIYPSQAHVEKKISGCEQIFRSRGLDVVFKLTCEAEPRNLDELLEERGYGLTAPTSVQILDLAGVDALNPMRSIVVETVFEDWVAAMCRLSDTEAHYQPTIHRMLCNLIPDRGFLSMVHERKVIACGIAVIQDGFVGLFDLVVDKGYRGLGYGQQVLTDLLVWAKRKGAHTSYLQVLVSNAPAVTLYAKNGFKEIYQYWYRVRV